MGTRARKGALFGAIFCPLSHARVILCVQGGGKGDSEEDDNEDDDSDDVKEDEEEESIEEEDDDEMVAKYEAEGKPVPEWLTKMTAACEKILNEMVF